MSNSASLNAELQHAYENRLYLGLAATLEIGRALNWRGVNEALKLQSIAILSQRVNDWISDFEQAIALLDVGKIRMEMERYCEFEETADLRVILGADLFNKWSGLMDPAEDIIEGNE